MIVFSLCNLPASLLTLATEREREGGRAGKVVKLELGDRPTKRNNTLVVPHFNRICKVLVARPDLQTHFLGKYNNYQPTLLLSLLL